MAEKVRVAVVGAGPKGSMMVNRLCARAAGSLDLDIHVVEPFTPGAGRVWRGDQAWSLLTNTAAAGATVFPPHPAGLTGPNVHEWAVMVQQGRVGGLSRRCREFAATVGPQTAVPRAFHGAYLEWSFQHLLRSAHGMAAVHLHRGKAVSLVDLPDGTQRLVVDNGVGVLDVDAVVLTQGHYDVGLTAPERAKAVAAQELGLTYLPPTNAGEADLSGIAAGEPVILNGLGLSFYDYVTLLSVGRGGRFRSDAGLLRYVRSGDEPVIYAGSGRGVPHPVRADSQTPGPQPFVPRFFTEAGIAAVRRLGPGTGDFARDLLPLLSKEVAWAFYAVQLSRCHGPYGFAEFEQRYAAADWDSPRMHELVAEYFPDPRTRWDWDRCGRPAAGRRFGDRAEFGRFVTKYHGAVLDQDAAGIERSPLRAATAVLRRLREPLRRALCHHGVAGSSYHRDVERWFDSLSRFLVWGPPPERVAQLLALVEAGVVTLTGPESRVAIDHDAPAFTIESSVVDGPMVTARVLIDARLPSTDVRNATDPLMASLLAAGDCRPHVIGDAFAPNGHQVGSVDVAEDTFMLVRSDGSAHPRRFAYGVPLRGVLGPYGPTFPAVVDHSDAIAAAMCASVEVTNA